jgi:hypothetical protein
MKIEQARELAAQLWCEPQHSHKVMDVDLAESIAQLLVKRDTYLPDELQQKVSSLIEHVARRRLARPECDHLASRILELVK